MTMTRADKVFGLIVLVLYAACCCGAVAFGPHV